MNGGDMAEPSKDPAIKLFGMKIPVPDARVPAEPEIKVCVLSVLLYMCGYVRARVYIYIDCN